MVESHVVSLRVGPSSEEVQLHTIIDSDCGEVLAQERHVRDMSEKRCLWNLEPREEHFHDPPVPISLTKSSS